MSCQGVVLVLVAQSVGRWRNSTNVTVRFVVSLGLNKILIEKEKGGMYKTRTKSRFRKAEVVQLMAKGRNADADENRVFRCFTFNLFGYWRK